MKLLTLVRHAKSSWSDPNARDFDRALNPRGLRDAPEMARRLLARGCIPTQITSSPARRTRETSELIASGLALTSDVITYKESLYEASTGDLLHIIGQLDDDIAHAMLIGHNPSIETLTGMLGERVLHTPSCAVSHYQFECDEWRNVSGSAVSLLFHDFPKKTDHL